MQRCSFAKCLAALSFDQWRNHKPSPRVIYFGRSAAGASNRPELYSVVE